MMKKTKVKGSQEVVPLIEFSVDTVYVRSNVEPFEDNFFKGWQYDEIQYSSSEYQEIINERSSSTQEDAAALGEMVAYLLTELEALKREVRGNG